MFEEVVMNLIEENAMQYGLYLPNYGVFGDVRLLADLAREAEAVGWDGFFLWDHIAEQYEDTTTMLPMIDPWVALAAIAMQTEKLRIGTTVTPLPRRRPWKLARETVSIDRLSNGRLILGVGIGAGELEWDHLGEETDLRSRGQMLDEGLDILTGLWSGEPFSYSGKHYQIEHAQFLPTPVQQPRIPIWVGGLWGNKAGMVCFPCSMCLVQSNMRHSRKAFNMYSRFDLTRQTHLTSSKWGSRRGTTPMNHEGGFNLR
jgi:alkanesulfonate monooxygenase SsuD/methylene tetrahydromethanopterin reductase-like flavin-dependent oxidoreductase (luciferase family)